MENQLTGNRNNQFDIEKGIGIAFMIAGHTGLISMIGLNNFIGSFYMPLFFMISGYFYKADGVSIKKFLQKKLFTLIVPYMVFGVLHWGIWMLMWKVGVSLQITPMQATMGLLWNNNQFFPISGALWFLTCLFGTSFFFRVLDEIKNRMAKVLIISISVFIGLYIRPFLPWSFDSALTAMGFYSIGHLWKIHGQKIYDNLKNTKRRNIILVLVVMIHLILVLFNGYTNMRGCNYGKIPILFFCTGILGTAEWYLITDILEKNRKVKGIDIFCRGIIYIGKNSITYLCLNQIFITIINRILKIQSLVWCLFETILIVLLLTIADKLIKFMKLEIFLGKR